jgi:2-dehydro-3-deoxygluconokinase
MSQPVKCVTFGEIMLRLSPPGFERLFQSPVLQATFGGGEANVAVSLAHFGFESHYVTRVPANPVGDAAVRALRAEGVHTAFVQRGGSRIGIYFAETGASQRASTVVYDRAGASVATIKPGEVPWAGVLEGAAWFHVTGITPALGPAVADATREALSAAREAGARISLDLNYRAKLWGTDRARDVMRPLASMVDVVIANEEDIQACLGLEVHGADVTAGQLDMGGYRDVAQRVVREFGVKQVAITLRESYSASRNGWSAALFDGATGQFHEGPRYDVTLVDRIGGGDSFAAGLIYGLATGRTAESALRFAVAASALKQTIPGDFNRVSAAEVDRLAQGDQSGRVQR